MKTKELVLMALLVAVGAALYLVIPGYNSGMKPDFMLTMMFIGILLFPNVKNVLLLALSTGVISGIFSTFPLGFFPNIIDKLITAFVFFAVITLFSKAAKNVIGSTIFVAFGTLVSGAIFLSVAFFILGVKIPGVENPFIFFYMTVVLPAVVLNVIAFIIINPIVIKLAKRSSFKTAVLN